MDWLHVYFSSILELNLGPDETFIWDLDFPDLLKTGLFLPVLKKLKTGKT